MVSAVILAYNRCNEVLITIENLKAYRLNLPFEMEIIVVDNESHDDTSQKISSLHPDVKLITRIKNNGIAGWNDGFAIAKYPYMLVLDDDSHIYNGLPEAIERLDSRPEIGILAFQIKDKNLQTDPYLDPEKAWKDNDDLVGFIGCGAIIRTELYKKIGGFADWIYVYTHEFEYGIRCLNAGYNINFFGKGVVIHRVSAINRSNKRQRIYATRNELAIVYKYFKSNKLKYLFRVLVNNLKIIKREGILSGWYVITGIFKFLELKSNLVKTPVSLEVQKFYADNFWSTKPVVNKK